MELVGLPDGLPGRHGGHLGVSHTLKHYLNPGEAWEDVAPDHVSQRLLLVLARVAAVHPRPWLQWGPASEVMRPCWDGLLVPAYRQGYLLTVNKLVYSSPAPGRHGWQRCRDGWGRVTREGVVVIVAERTQGPTLLTAFRPVGRPPRDGRALPTSDEHRRLRAEMARRNGERALREEREVAS